MNFNELIIEENGDLQVLNQLRNSNKDIYVYGCGAYAEAVCAWLVNNKLTVSGFLVDHCYYKSDFYLSGLKVYDISDYYSELNNMNIVIGFCNIEKAKFLMQNSGLVNGNYFMIWQYDGSCLWNLDFIKENSHILNTIYHELYDKKSKIILEKLTYAKLNYKVGDLIEYADSNQYFNELTYCMDSQDEIYVDCGAFNGDTIIKYSEFANGMYKRIYAFEPDKDNQLLLKKNIAHLNNVKIIDKGSWYEDATLFFNSKGSGSFVSEQGEESIQVTSIDAVVKNDKVTFIKMDIEGSELEALHGAENTIRNNFPKLAICCYHKQRDIIDLYSYIKSFNNEFCEYKFFLRHHSNGVSETVLYAIPQIVRN